MFDTGGYNERSELKKRLNDLNLSLEDINIVFISHLHFDHCVNWVFFPNAKIVVGEVEISSSFTSEDINIPDFHLENLLMHKNLVKVKNGDYLWGFEVILLPGHTKGLIGLRNNDIFIVSDAIKNRTEINEMKLMNVMDEKNALETIKFLNDNASVIYPGHDGRLVKVEGKWDISENLNETIFISNFKDSNFTTKIL